MASYDQCLECGAYLRISDTQGYCASCTVTWNSYGQYASGSQYDYQQPNYGYPASNYQQQYNQPPSFRQQDYAPTPRTSGEHRGRGDADRSRMRPQAHRQPQPPREVPRDEQSPPPQGYQCRKCLEQGVHPAFAARHKVKYCSRLTQKERNKAARCERKILSVRGREKLADYEDAKDRIIAEYEKEAARDCKANETKVKAETEEALVEQGTAIEFLEWRVKVIAEQHPEDSELQVALRVLDEARGKKMIGDVYRVIDEYIAKIKEALLS